VSDEARLAALSARLRGMKSVSGEIAAAAAPGVALEARRTANEGTTPTGEPWEGRKSDGAAPLKNASGAISAVVSGTTEGVLTLVLKGHHIFHQRGTKRVPKRQILPTLEDGLPKRMRAELEKAAGEVIARKLGGG
jgi:hypothetical protein